MSTRKRSSEGGPLPAAAYAFRVAEPLTTTTLGAFPELQAADPATGSVLYGRLRDRSELFAILERLDLLGLTILEFYRLPE
jgi:hypothetical protein